MRLICVQRDKLQPLGQFGANIDDLTPKGLWDTAYHIVSMSDEQFEALRKLLGDRSTYQDITPRSLTQLPSAGSGFLYCRGGKIPNGLKLRATHLSRSYEAEVRGGKVWLESKAHDSPSTAARVITKTAVNGWKFWEYLDDERGCWFPLLRLRSKRDSK